MKALVVDDSRIMRMLMVQMLKDVGFTEVAQAQDGKGAMAYFDANPDTEVALVDWQMPEMNGIQLVEAVRRDSRLNDVRLVMVTTQNELAHVKHALELGANEYVMKPFTKDVIGDKLRLLGLEL
jgi:two-component system chemotaxis response regulator CheY